MTDCPVNQTFEEAWLASVPIAEKVARKYSKFIVDAQDMTQDLLLTFPEFWRRYKSNYVIGQLVVFFRNKALLIKANEDCLGIGMKRYAKEKHGYPKSLPIDTLHTNEIPTERSHAEQRLGGFRCYTCDLELLRENAVRTHYCSRSCANAAHRLRKSNPFTVLRELRQGPKTADHFEELMGRAPRREVDALRMLGYEISESSEPAKKPRRYRRNVTCFSLDSEAKVQARTRKLLSCEPV